MEALTIGSLVSYLSLIVCLFVLCMSLFKVTANKTYLRISALFIWNQAIRGTNKYLLLSSVSCPFGYHLYGLMNNGLLFLLIKALRHRMVFCICDEITVLFFTDGSN